MKNFDEKGNVLFVILIAVALFGALSFAVSNMMRGGENAGFTQEQLNLYAGEILDGALQIRSAVQEARISFDCQDTDISFVNDVVSGYAHSPAAPDECQIFHESLGSVKYSVPPADWLDSTQVGEDAYGEWRFLSGTCVPEVGTGGSDCNSVNGASDSDLTANVFWLRRDVCLAINDALGIENPNGSPPQISTTEAWDATNPSTGTYGVDGTINAGGSTDTSILDGVVAGCYEGNQDPPAGTYHFYQVLIAR